MNDLNLLDDTKWITNHDAYESIQGVNVDEVSDFLRNYETGYFWHHLDEYGNINDNMMYEDISIFLRDLIDREK